MSDSVGFGPGRRGVLPRLDRQTVRAHLVDVNDGVIATAGVVEGVVGAAVPLVVSALAPAAWRIPLTVLAVVAALCLTATLVARLGGMRVGRTVLRTVAIGMLTMLLTLAGGSLFDL